MYVISKNFNVVDECLQISDHLNCSVYSETKSILDDLLSAFKEFYTPKEDNRESFFSILKWMQVDQKFTCDSDNYFSLNSLDLGVFLKKRNGQSLSLAILAKYLADSVNLKVGILMLPSDSLISVSSGSSTSYFSFFNFNEIPYSSLKSLIISEKGLFCNHKFYFKPLNKVDVLIRYILEIKSIAVLNKMHEISFQAINILINWQGRSANWIKERAFIAQEIGCTSFAKQELENLIEQDPDSPFLDFLRYRLYEMRYQFNIYH